ncbi:MAG: creatininase family protein, partial [Chloroflexota bacterium]
MQWENLTSYDFEQAVQTCQGVAILPIGVIESHASHLPLGTDMFVAHYIACSAAKQEPILVFPQYPYSINHETAHLPGGVVIKREIAFALLENICDEMHRNGINKIILLSGHGGNRVFLPLFVQTLPEKSKPYAVYVANLPIKAEDEAMVEHREYGHAGEVETSMILHIKEDLVKMDQIPPKSFTNAKRNQAIAEAGGYSQVDWYAMYPHMYVGNAHKSTAEKGRQLLEPHIQYLIKLIQAVKADETAPSLIEEFNQR